jgi:hypothetical protein
MPIEQVSAFDQQGNYVTLRTYPDLADHEQKGASKVVLLIEGRKGPTEALTQVQLVTLTPGDASLLGYRLREAKFAFDQELIYRCTSAQGQTFYLEDESMVSTGMCKGSIRAASVELMLRYVYEAHYETQRHDPALADLILHLG